MTLADDLARSHSGAGPDPYTLGREVSSGSWDRAAATQDAAGLILKAERLNQLGRTSEARSAFRKVAESYHDSARPEVLDSVITALCREWDLCMEHEDVEGALAHCEYVAVTFQGRADERVVRFVAATLYKAAVECRRRRETARGLALCLEVERRFARSWIPGVARVVTAAQALGGLLAKARRDTHMALKLFVSASSALAEPADRETATVIAWAHFQMAECLLDTHRYEEALALCTRFMARSWAHAQSTELESTMACMMLLGATCELALAFEGGAERLQQLVLEHRGHPNSRVQTSLAVARRRLALEEIES